MLILEKVVWNEWSKPHIKKLQNEEQMKSEVNRKKKIIRVKINEIENS